MTSLSINFASRFRINDPSTHPTPGIVVEEADPRFLEGHLDARKGRDVVHHDENESHRPGLIALRHGQKQQSPNREIGAFAQFDLVNWTCQLISIVSTAGTCGGGRRGHRRSRR